MAKAAKIEAEGVDVAPPRKKSKKLLIIVIAAVFLVLAVGGGLAFFLMKGHADEEGEDGEVATANMADKKSGGKESAPVYAALDAFTVNLAPENGEQFLQLVLSVEVADAKVGDRLKLYTPKIRNNIMMLLSGKKASELLQREGKEKLAAEILDLINEVLEPNSKAKKDAPAKEVLFTSFIIQ